jgi:hypothetical protein
MWMVSEVVVISVFVACIVWLGWMDGLGWLVWFG